MFKVEMGTRFQAIFLEMWKGPLSGCQGWPKGYG